jgi:hypothetical protein
LVITRTSAPDFYIDASNQIVANYVSFAVYNDTTNDLGDSWTSLGSFTGGNSGLAQNETGTIHLGAIPSGVTKTAFFYVNVTQSATAQGATVSVYGSKPPATLLASQVFSWGSVINSGQNNSNQVSTVLSGPNPDALGGVIDMTISGTTGTLGSQNVMFFTPASYGDWPADKFQLVGVDITWGNGYNSASNVLAITGTTNADQGAYTAVYHLRALGSTSTQVKVSPIGFFAQGSNIGHTNTGGYASANFLPTTSLASYLTLSKSADVLYAPYQSVVHYHIRVTNSGPLDATMDQIIDQLPVSPGLPTVVAGSSTWDGAAVADPVASGSQLVWSGQFYVPGTSSLELAFDVILAGVPGTYTNTAYGYVGTTLIDRTIDSTDNSPSAWSVSQNSPTITPTFSVSPTPTPSFTSVPPGSTATITPSNSPTITPSPTGTPSLTHSATRTPTLIRTFTMTPTLSPTNTPAVGTPTNTPTRTLSFTLTATPTRTPTNSPTATPTSTQSATFTLSPTFSSSPTVTPSGSITPTFSITGTFTNSPTDTPTATPSQTSTNTPTASPTFTATSTFTDSPTITPTPTITVTYSNSPTFTPTSTITLTPTPVTEPVLAKPWPNPFRPLLDQRLRLDLGVALAGTVKVKVFNLAGELVDTVFEGNALNGTLTIYWDGTNKDGDLVASGMYLVLAETPSGPVRALVGVIK